MIDPETGEYVRTFTTERVVWQGIEIEVRFEANFLEMNRSHVEVESINPPRTPLPVTETGYRSAFPMEDEIEAYGGAVAWVLAGLDAAAKSKGWKAKAAAVRQLELF